MMRRATGAILAIAALAAIVAGSHVRLAAFAAPSAVLRLSWSARPERVEQCRRLSDEEFAKLPAHMRRRVECEGTTARYRLEVQRDDVVLAVDTVRGGGLRHDRELYVFREIAVPPGTARITVRFARIDSSSTADTLLRADTSVAGDPSNRSAREDAERERRRAEAIPPRVVLDTTVALVPRTVLLVTYSETGRQLVVRGAP